MATLGSPKTRKLPIGTYELRLGPLSKAGRLTAEHSVGVIDECSITAEQNSVDRLAGFPQKPVDTAITSIISGITAKMGEVSKRNIDIILGNAYADYAAAATDVNGTVDTTSAYAAGATAIVMDSSFSGTPAANDVWVFFEVGNPGNVSVCLVDSYESGTKTITLDANTPLVAPTGTTNTFAAGSVVKAYKSALVTFGGVTSVNYYSAQLLRLDRGTSRTVGFNFWKVAVSAGATIAGTPTEFASLDLSLKCLEPAASEYATGAVMDHLADLIPLHPIGMMFDVSDGAS